MKLKRAKPVEPKPGRIKAADVVGRPEAGHEFYINPRQEITEDDWQSIKDQMDRYRRKQEWIQLISLAIDVAAFFPDRREEYDLTDDDLQKFREKIESDRETIRTNTNTTALEFLVTYFPETREKVGINNEWNRLKAALDIHRSDSNWKSFRKTASHLVVLFPERRTELGLDDTIFQQMKLAIDSSGDFFEQFLDILQLVNLFPERKAELGLDDKTFKRLRAQLESTRERELEKYILHAAQLMVIFPEKTTEFSLTGKEWIQLREVLDSYRNDSKWEDFSGLALQLSFFSANRVEMKPYPRVVITPKPPPLRAEHTLPDRSVL